MTGSFKNNQPIMNSNSNEHGAIIIEATVSLSIFMFAIYIVLSIVQICYTQERIAVALNSATKQMAQCSHVLRATGVDKIVSGNDGSTTQIANKVAEFLKSLGGELADIELVPEELSGFVTDAGGALENDSIMDVIRTSGADGIIKVLMEKNLSTDGCSGLDDFNARHNVENMEFIGSNYIENGRNIYMKINYDIRVVRLLNFERVFHLSHGAYNRH